MERKQPTLKQVMRLMFKINRNPNYNAYFKGTNGEVHLVVEENAITILEGKK